MKNIKKNRVHPMVIMDSVITGFRLFGIFMVLALREAEFEILFTSFSRISFTNSNRYI